VVRCNLGDLALAARKAVDPPPGHVSVDEAMRMLGCSCRRRILTEFVRYGLLPYPTDGLWFKRADVERVLATFEERRRKAGMTRDQPKP